MTAWRSGALALALCLAAPPPAAHAVDGPVPHRTLFTIGDPDVFESSGLVDRGETVYTIDDSGGDAIVYGLSARTGETVSRSTYADEVTDVEALAPGADGTVWTGDTGDNRGNRDEIAVYRVRPEDGRHPGQRFALAYPDRPHDAETLLVQPRTGRVFVVTKSPFGGTVYAAPRALRTDRVNRLVPFAKVSGLVTDGSFYPDGRHLVLRTYGSATVYTFPAFARVGSVRLPSQPQGEGISVSSAGRVLVSSEGVHSDVLRVTLPAAFTAPVRTRSTPPIPPPVRPADPGPGPRGLWDWAGIALGGVAVVALGYLTMRGSRVRAPRAR